jgi:hypothetical protein
MLTTALIGLLIVATVAASSGLSKLRDIRDQLRTIGKDLNGLKAEADYSNSELLEIANKHLQLIQEARGDFAVELERQTARLNEILDTVERIERLMDPSELDTRQK